MSVLALLQASDLGKLLPQQALRLAAEAERARTDRRKDGQLSKEARDA